MQPDHTQRFSARAEDYARYRPRYPGAVAELLASECALAADCRIADIGSGTGLLAAMFLDFGCEVFGVEPNLDMRRAGETALAGLPRFHSVDGRAEATTLPSDSVDFVAAGQAFHWFDPPAAQAEFRRIFRAPGWVVLIYNERLPLPGFMAAYEELVARYAPECPPLAPFDLDRFFGDTSWRLAKLPNQQQLDLAGLQGRFLSSSRAPLPGSTTYEPLLEDLRRVFEQHQTEGRVTLPYETEVYYGRLPK